MAKKLNRAKLRSKAARATQDVKKASAQYNEVGASAFDIKSLIASVAVAQSQKVKGVTASNKKKVEKLVSLVEQKVEADLQLEIAQSNELDEATAALEVKIKDNEALIKTHNEEVKPETKSEEQSERPQAPTSATRKERKEALAAVRRFQFLLDEAVSVAEDDEESGPLYVKELTRAASAAASAIGKISRGLTQRLLQTRFLAVYREFLKFSGQFSRIRQWISKMGDVSNKEKKGNKPNPALKNAKKLGANKLGDAPRKQMGGVNSLLTSLPAPVAALIVKSTSSIGTGLTAIGKAIKSNGIDTMKWVGKRISDMTSKVLGLFRSAKNFLTGGGAADLIAMGAVALGILPSLIDGLVGELKARFGDNFVMGFINEKWEDTKKFVTDWLSKFIDSAVSAIKNLPETLAKVGEGAKKAASNAAHMAKEFMTPDTAERKVAKDRLAIKQAGGVPPLRQFVNLIDEYDAATGSRRSEISAKITTLVNATPSLQTEPRVVSALSSRGISLTARINNASNTSTTTVSAPKADNKAGSPAGAPASDSGGGNTTVSNPTSNTNVSVAVPPTPSEPVTAEKPVPPPQSGGGASSDSSDGSSGSSGGLTNASVPNNAADDSLIFMNIASMGG